MISVGDEICRQLLAEEAKQIRERLGAPVLIVIAATASGRKIIVGADFDFGAVPHTPTGAAEAVARICLNIAETPNPDDVKLYGEGRSS